MFNRIGRKEFGASLKDVANQPGAFESLRADSPRWALSGDPAAMNRVDRHAWGQAQQAAADVLNHRGEDPTGGAVNFIAARLFDDLHNHKGDFARARVANGDWYRSPYVSPDGKRTYFFLEEPGPKPHPPPPPPHQGIVTGPARGGQPNLGPALGQPSQPWFSPEDQRDPLWAWPSPRP